MSAKYEKRSSGNSAQVWVGKYRNLHNLSHWHLEHELVVCETGEARLVLDGRALSLSADTAALCPGGSVHHIDADEDSVVIAAQFDPALTRSITGQYQLQSTVFGDRYGAARRLEEIDAELKAKNDFYRERTAAIMVQLIAEIFRGEARGPIAQANSGSLLRYKKLLTEINENAEFITFEQAAQAMHMTQAYFSRFFKKISGMTFSSYLNLIKVDKATELLRAAPDTPCEELMLQCGFNTLRNFQRVFKEYTGYSPRQLPENYYLSIKTVSDSQSGFDPTLASSVLL